MDIMTPHYVQKKPAAGTSLAAGFFVITSVTLCENKPTVLEGKYLILKYYLSSDISGIKFNC